MAGALAYAADGKVIADIELQPLSAINGGLDRLDHGDVASRVVLEFSDNRGERPYYDKFASYKGRSLDIRQVEASSFLRTYSFNSETSP